MRQIFIANGDAHSAPFCLRPLLPLLVKHGTTRSLLTNQLLLLVTTKLGLVSQHIGSRQFTFVINDSHEISLTRGDYQRAVGSLCPVEKLVAKLFDGQQRAIGLSNGKGSAQGRSSPHSSCRHEDEEQTKELTFHMIDVQKLWGIYFTRQTLRTMPLNSCDHSGAQTKRELFSQP